MTLGQLLDDIREGYLTQFRRTLLEMNDAGAETWVEPACRDQSGALAREGALSLPMRLDLVSAVESGQEGIIRVDSDSRLAFEPIAFEWSGGVSTRLAPFHWDGIQVRVEFTCEPTEWSPLVNWFDRWFDGEDTHPPDGDGLRGVIHFLSDPMQKDTATSFEADFGSAPVKAFEEFLDALHDCGAVKVEIGGENGA